MPACFGQQQQQQLLIDAPASTSAVSEGAVKNCGSTSGCVHDACAGMCALQVNMQALVLVSLFRQQTRARIIEAIEWCLPDRIPWVRAPPFLAHLFVKACMHCLALLAPADQPVLAGARHAPR